MATPNYIVDKTPLAAIQYDLQKAAMYGDGAVLGLLKMGGNGGYASIITGGLKTGWRARKINGIANKRLFDVLLLPPVTVAICRDVIAVQVNGVILVKVDETPFDGSTPQQWTFEMQFNSSDKPIVL